VSFNKPKSRFKVLEGMLLNLHVTWEIVPFSTGNIHVRFEKSQCLHLHLHNSSTGRRKRH